MANKFRHYVSLGYNCEVAFQFRRILGHDSSSFFSWNVTTFAALTSLIDNDFSGILLPENLSKHGDGSLVFDSSHQFCFHSPFTTPTPQDDPKFDEHLSIFREKTAHLLRKFKDVAGSGEPVAYFYKATEGDARAKACAVRSILDRYHGDNPNYLLIILQLNCAFEQSWDEPRIANRYLRRFSSYDDASDGHVSSYDKVFREFPHVDTMYFSGY